MKIGFIGAGSVAQTYAKYFVRAGHEVVLSNSKGPDSLTETVRLLGPNAKAGTVTEAAQQDIVILAVRWEKAQEVLTGILDWKGRILVDATNRPLDLDTQGKTSSELIARQVPGATVIKGLNTLIVSWLPAPTENKHKLVLFLSGDDKDAKKKFAGVLEEAGFVPVDIGGLSDGGKLQQFGGPLNALHMDLLKRMIF